MALHPQGMADEMENQLRCLWAQEWGHELPDTGTGREQRMILFRAIARGIFQYLNDQEAGDQHLFSDVTLRYASFAWDVSYSVQDLTWNLEIPPCDDE